MHMQISGIRWQCGQT